MRTKREDSTLQSKAYRTNRDSPRTYTVNYQEALDWLYATQTFGIKLGLEGPTRLLREFLAFPSHRTKVIHVAGTNGKGSTCAMIDALGQGLALRSGLFTSPPPNQLRVHEAQLRGFPSFPW